MLSPGQRTQAPDSTRRTCFLGLLNADMPEATRPRSHDREVVARDEGFLRACNTNPDRVTTRLIKQIRGMVKALTGRPRREGRSPDGLWG